MQQLNTRPIHQCIALVSAACVAFVSPAIASAQDPSPTYRPADEPPPDYRPAEAPPPGSHFAAKPVDAASGGVGTAEVLDYIAFGLVLVGGALASDEDLLTASVASFSLASVFFTFGGLVGTISYSIRQSAYADAGYQVSGGPQAVAWLLTALTTASFAASVTLSVFAIEEDDFGLGLGSLGATLGAVLFETINWLAVRNGSWTRALDAAEPVDSISQLPIVPTMGFVRRTSFEAPTPTFGFAMRF
jgi:hypothetical protein